MSVAPSQSTALANDSLSLCEAVESTVYEIVPRGQLPGFDPSRTVKKAVVPASQLRRVNKFLIRYHRVILVAYVLGIALRVLTVVLPAATAQWTAVGSLIVQIPAVINIVFQFRLGFLVLLIRTYDFWYYFVANAVWGVCFAWYFGDWRIAMLPLMLVDVQNATLLDSFLQDFQVIVLAIWFWCAFLCGAMVTVSLDAVDAVDSELDVFKTRVRTVRLKEVLLNAIGTIVVLVVRVLYRRRAALHSQRKSTERMVQSITYRWPLKLQPRHGGGSFLGTSREWTGQWPDFNARQLHLRITTRSKPLKAKDVVCPQAFALLFMRLSPCQHAFTRLTGFAGLIATPVVFILHGQHREGARVVGVVALFSTTWYCGMLLLFYQRKLLQRVCFSFDFAFISLQLILAHVCLADLYRWQLEPTLGLLCSCIWMLAVMTLDALTPVVRRLLGFHSWFQVPVFLLFQAAVILLLFELFLWDSQTLDDRCFLRVRIGNSHLVQLHVVPLLASRMVSLSLWVCRMLLRIAMRESDHDLLVIQSHVAYSSVFQRRQERRVQAQLEAYQTHLRALATRIKSVREKALKVAVEPT